MQLAIPLVPSNNYSQQCTTNHENPTDTQTNIPYENQERRAQPYINRTDSRKPYICSVKGCNRSFVHCRNLRQHETKNHGRVPSNQRRSMQDVINKPHSCPVSGCQKRFFHAQSIRRHVALIHSELQPHVGEIVRKMLQKNESETSSLPK